MNKFILKLSLLFLITLDSLGAVKWVSFEELAPTQMSIGEYAVSLKIEKILKEERKGKLREYLLKKTAPAYLAANGRYYIIDRHHTSLATLYARTSLNEYPIDVIADYSHMTMTDFFTHLEEHNNLYLFHRGQGPYSPFDLPQFLWELKDDPYRSFATLIRKAGGYDKVDIPFLEFIWGDYFRKVIAFTTGDQFELERLKVLGLKAARSSQASHLPGFRGISD